uniref:Putative mitochondrial carrier protein n=1 Tax=Trypanosoma congolense (strain IL3000) TaxID=1068625 RepID=G0URV9_TRYCI|nr:putative mitochondrial carrier protein [Trypanosoma congolense IL3000]
MEESGGKKRDAQPSASDVALASSCATFLTKSLLHPIDTTKCRIQSSSRKSVRSLCRQYHGMWGPKYLYSGLPVKLVFTVPYQSLYMTTYTATKGVLDRCNAESQSRVMFLCRTIGAATAAELSGCILRVPMETMKMRLQAGAVRSTAAAVYQIRNHGFAGFRRMVLPQTILHDIPYSATQWIVYETFRPWTKKITESNQPGEQTGDKLPGTTRFYSYVQRFLRTVVAGGFSALAASILTIPLDAIRTRTVVAASVNPNITISSLVQETYRLGGIRMFFKGGVTRVFWVTSNMALYLPLYELLLSSMQS